MLKYKTLRNLLEMRETFMSFKLWHRDYERKSILSINYDWVLMVLISLSVRNSLYPNLVNYFKTWTGPNIR